MQPEADGNYRLDRLRLRGLVDWVYLHATEGQCWPSRTTQDRLIDLALVRRPNQVDAETMKGNTMEITTHRADGDTNDGLAIHVVDEPGSGGANHVYLVTGLDLRRNDAWLDAPTNNNSDAPDHGKVEIAFQCGGIPDHGVNGLTHEALLAIVAHRLECFQNGPFPSQENANALQNVNEALRSLHKRTLARIKRGVEGQQVA